MVYLDCPFAEPLTLEAFLMPVPSMCSCTTCNLGAAHCPGHFGHIELPLPVYNPLIFGWVHGRVDAEGKPFD
jgi:DNA-directed RNA polymerase beta' subunit